MKNSSEQQEQKNIDSGESGMKMYKATRRALTHYLEKLNEEDSKQGLHLLSSLCDLLLSKTDRMEPGITGQAGQNMDGENIIDMILFCPNCRFKHIDEPNLEKNWSNPPHKSHECQKCNWVWRPADICTNGVTNIKTKGKRDSENLIEANGIDNGTNS